eukprot:sb/3477738/
MKLFLFSRCTVVLFCDISKLGALGFFHLVLLVVMACCILPGYLIATPPNTLLTSSSTVPPPNPLLLPPDRYPGRSRDYSAGSASQHHGELRDPRVSDRGLLESEFQ